MIVHEAATTFVAVYDALIGWLIFAATVGSILVLAAIATGARGGRAAWSWLYARLRAEEPPDGPGEPRNVPEASQRRTRHTPSWARTDHHNYGYEEAA